MACLLLGKLNGTPFSVRRKWGGSEHTGSQGFFSLQISWQWETTTSVSVALFYIVAWQLVRNTIYDQLHRLGRNINTLICNYKISPSCHSGWSLCQWFAHNSQECVSPETKWNKNIKMSVMPLVEIYQSTYLQAGALGAKRNRPDSVYVYDIRSVTLGGPYWTSYVCISWHIKKYDE